MYNILVTSSNKFTPNGITNTILNFYNNIDSNKFKIDFVLINEPSDELIALFHSKNSKFYVLSERITSPVRYMRKLYKICCNGDYDIIHANGNSNSLGLELFTSRLAGIKVRIAHSHSTKCKNNFINYIFKPFFNNYTHAFACSNLAGNWLFKDNQYTIINNAFTIKDFEFDKNKRLLYREKFSISDKFVIGNVALFNEGKNHFFLLNIFKELLSIKPNSILILVGDGYLKNKIIIKAKEYKIYDKIIFLGLRDDVCEIINCFDLFLFPSLYEGLGLVLIEAQINGLPVLCSDSVPECVKFTDNLDFLSLGLDAKYWANFLINKNLSRNIGGLSLAKEKGFEIKSETKRLETLYIDFINGRR
ncbi:MAG: glycosyltransferase [Sphaerochaetaceae bacterium]|nr:glycosyltransferase [Sphaerochaetaceae bacterium]